MVQGHAPARRFIQTQGAGSCPARRFIQTQGAGSCPVRRFIQTQGAGSCPRATPRCAPERRVTHNAKAL